MPFGYLDFSRAKKEGTMHVRTYVRARAPLAPERVGLGLGLGSGPGPGPGLESESEFGFPT